MARGDCQVVPLHRHGDNHSVCRSRDILYLEADRELASVREIIVSSTVLWNMAIGLNSMQMVILRIGKM